MAQRRIPSYKHTAAGPNCKRLASPHPRIFHGDTRNRPHIPPEIAVPASDAGPLSGGGIALRPDPTEASRLPQLSAADSCRSVRGHASGPPLSYGRFGGNRFRCKTMPAAGDYNPAPLNSGYMRTGCRRLVRVHTLSQDSPNGCRLSVFGPFRKVSGDTFVGHSLLELRVEFAAFTRESATVKALQLFFDGFLNDAASAGVDTLAD